MIQFVFKVLVLNFEHYSYSDFGEFVVSCEVWVRVDYLSEFVWDLGFPLCV